MTQEQPTTTSPAARASAPGKDAPGQDAPPVLIERRGSLGLITLNRPRAINALTHQMVLLVLGALTQWEHDEDVHTVAITGAGERGLCAGGDIVTLYEAAAKGPAEPAVEFWADEYQMNAAIAAYRKPVVAIQDGLVLGGGIGISAHASHRVATERSRLGFPEVTIGFVPDVGGTWLLSRAPGELGTRMALTGAHVGAGDAIAAGLSDVVVPSESLDDLLTRLQTTGPDAAIAELRTDPGPAPLAEQEGTDEVFAGADVAAILDALQGQEPWQDVAQMIATKSPTALVVTLAALRRVRDLGSLEEALEQEFAVSTHHLTSPDFAEGIRAQVIDKDRNPAWNPAELAQVSPAVVDQFFAPSPWGSFRAPRLSPQESR